MPFTFAHPFVVVPLTRHRLVFSALVVGSMAPDFEYFFRLSTHSRFCHTMPGLFIATLPMGLAILWGFHVLMKKPLIALLPKAHQERLLPLAGHFPFFPISRFLLIVLSLVIGIASHIFLDGFTHLSGFFVTVFPVLATPILVTFQGSIFVYTILQYGGSLLGFWLMWIWYWRWFRQASPRPSLIVVEATCNVKTALFPLSAFGIAVPYVFLYSYRIPFRNLFNSMELLRDGLVYVLLTWVLVLFLEFLCLGCYVRLRDIRYFHAISREESAQKESKGILP